MSSTGTSSTSSSSLRSSTGTSHVWDRNVSLSGTCKCTESRGIGQYYRCLRCRQAVHKDCVTTYDNTVCEPSYRDLVIGQEVEHPTPLIAFVSSKAGGGQGKALIEKLQIALSADQVFDLFADPSNVGPRAGIDKWKNTPNLRILVCGGDGTVCWVLHELVDRTPFQKPNEIDLAQSAKVPISTHCIVVPDSRADVPTPLHTDDSATDVGSFPAPPMHEAPAPPTPEEQALATQALATEPTSRESAEDATYIDLSQEIRLPEADELLPLPPVAVLPLGTGNDTSRILGWGGGYSNEDIVGVLESICSAQPVLMDRWTVEFEPPLQDGAKVINSLGMLNYFSVGVDAQVALKFHKLRNANPQLFFHRNVNKGVYGAFGMLSAVTGENLERVPVVITLDNDKPQSISGLESVIVCNIASYAGGTNLWGSSSDFAEPRFDDGQLEVMGITGIPHLSLVQTGVKSARRLAQSSSIRVNIGSPVAIQVDGEPFLYEGQVTIRFKNQARMLCRS